MKRAGLLIVLGVLSMQAMGQTPPVSSGLILNLQSDNIDGSNNSTLTDGQEITSWSDVAVGADNTTATDATSAGVNSFITAQGASTGTLGTSQGTPNYVAPSGGNPAGVHFTRTSSSVGEALGFVGAIGIGNGRNPFTAFVVANVDDSPVATMRSIQFGQVETSSSGDKHIVALESSSYRYNGANTAYPNGLQPGGTHLGTYIMNDGTFSNAIFRLDGNQLTGTATGTGSLNLTDGSYLVGLGTVGTGAPTDVFGGTINAIIIYNRVLDATELDQMESYLEGKFAVPEPACLGVMAIGAFVLQQRRQRRTRRITSSPGLQPSTGPNCRRRSSSSVSATSLGCRG